MSPSETSSQGLSVVVVNDISSDSDVSLDPINNRITWDGIIDEPEEIISSSSDEEREEDLAPLLAQWVIHYGVKHNATDSLLKLLRSRKALRHENLPSTSLTLLKTESEVATMVSGMEYIYLVLEKGIQEHFSRYSKEVTSTTDVIEISLNIDGLPIFSSNNMSLWPILCALHLEPVKVFPVANTCGPSKPKDYNRD